MIVVPLALATVVTGIVIPNTAAGNVPPIIAADGEIVRMFDPCVRLAFVMVWTLLNAAVAAPIRWGDNWYGIATVVADKVLTSLSVVNEYTSNAPVVPPNAVNARTLWSPPPGNPVCVNITRDVLLHIGMWY